MGFQVTENKIYYSGKEILLRGVAIPDIYWLEKKEKKKIKDVIREVKKLGFNCVRFVVVPGHFLFHENYLEEKVSNVVKCCKNEGLYCILDWHSLGNPITGKTKLQKYKHEINGKTIFWYSADFTLAKKGWKKLAKLFSGEKHVLFELFNEPAPGEKEVKSLDLEPLPWKKWKELQQELIDIIRKYTNKPIIVNSNYWTHNLLETSKSPYNDSQIIYAFHCYPIRNNSNWKEMLNSLKDKPIIITEWGFDNRRDLYFYGTITNYAKPLMDYCDKNKIHWTAWCFSSSWSPRMLKSWEPLSFTKFGRFIMSKMENKNEK